MINNIINLEDKRRTLKEAEEDRTVLCIITVRADSSVSTWVSDQIESGPQWSWLYGQIAAATAELVRMEGGVTLSSPER